MAVRGQPPKLTWAGWVPADELSDLLEGAPEPPLCRGRHRPEEAGTSSPVPLFTGGRLRIIDPTWRFRRPEGETLRPQGLEIVEEPTFGTTTAG
jgi:hypothetical protein